MLPLSVTSAAPVSIQGQVDAGPSLELALSSSPHVESVETILSIFFVAGIVLSIFFGMRWLRDPSPWRKGVSRLTWRPWSWKHLGLVLGTMGAVYLAVLGLAFGVHFIAGVDLWARRSMALLLGGVCFHLAGLLGVWILMSRRKLSWQSGFGISGSGFMHHVTLGGACYLAVLPFVAVSSLVYEKLLKHLGEDIGPQEVFEELARADSPGAVLLITLLAIVVAPVFEELLFRGLALPLLVKKFGSANGIFLLSVSFALIHFHVASLFPLFILGVALALAYVYSQSIVTPIIMHSLFNGINLVFFTVLKG